MGEFCYLDNLTSAANPTIVNPRMPVQTNLFPDPPASPPGSSSEPPPTQPRAPNGKMAPVWMQRLSLFMLVLFCVYLGVILAIVPWWSAVWDHNLLLQSRPAVWAVLRTGAARGIISGIGLLDIWIGISEAVHYRDFRGEKAASK